MYSIPNLEAAQSMVCNTAIRVPATSLGVTIQGQRSRGRPIGRGSEIVDVGKARARERIELEKEYTLQQVIDLLLLTHVCELSDLCVWQETFAAEIINSDDDFEPQPARGGGVGNGGGSGDSAGNGQVRNRGTRCWSRCRIMTMELAG